MVPWRLTCPGNQAISPLMRLSPQISTRMAVPKAAASELDANLLHVLAIINGRSREEREVVSRLLGALATHMDKKLASQ